jgi:hypothetical protein
MPLFWGKRQGYPADDAEFFARVYRPWTDDELEYMRASARREALALYRACWGHDVDEAELDPELAWPVLHGDPVTERVRQRWLRGVMSALECGATYSDVVDYLGGRVAQASVLIAEAERIKPGIRTWWMPTKKQARSA